jgi:putative CocE/NonD family hydrolase
LSFFDRYLKDKDISIAPVRYFLMGKNIWCEADTWPLPQTEWQRYYLHSRGNANSASGDGTLNRTEPGREPQDRYIYDPLNPVPTVGGAFIGGIGEYGLTPGPMEQASVENRRDVLCYTTSEFEKAVEISGPIKVHLFAATSVKDTDFSAKLVDVHPNGATHNLADGLMRASGLKSPDHGEPINPGEVYEYIIDMGHTSHVLKNGHCLRLDIASSSFPQFDRNMNTGNPIGYDSEGIPAIQTIFHQAEYVSHIDLPIISE